MTLGLAPRQPDLFRTTAAWCEGAGGARHGRKTAARGFDGYKGHIAVDPDSEIITATGVTAGNSGDAEAAAGLLADRPDGVPGRPGSARPAASS